MSIRPIDRRPPEFFQDAVMMIGLVALTAWVASRHGADMAGRSRSDSDRRASSMMQASSDRRLSAASPADIPARGWKAILWRTYEEIMEDRIIAVAAGVVFFLLLALFPAVTAFVSFYGLFADPRTVGQHLSMVAGLLPAGAFDIVLDQVNRIVGNGGGGKLTLAFLFSLGLAIWSANAGMKAIMDALNVAYNEREKRGFIALNALSLLFTVAALGALLCAIGFVVVMPLVLNFVGLTDAAAGTLVYLRWPALFVLIVIALSLLYRFGPSRRGVRWKWISIGSIAATAIWLAGSSLLSWYLANFANYNETYGSLGAAIGFMTWLWMTNIVVLVGAELNSQIEHQAAHPASPAVAS